MVHAARALMRDVLAAQYMPLTLCRVHPCVRCEVQRGGPSMDSALDELQRLQRENRDMVEQVRPAKARSGSMAALCGAAICAGALAGRVWGSRSSQCAHGTSNCFYQHGRRDNAGVQPTNSSGCAGLAAGGCRRPTGDRDRCRCR